MLSKVEDKSITWLRALATVMVVVQHVCNEYVNFDNSMLSVAAIFVRIFNVPAVPLFAMLSGHLIFGSTVEFSLGIAWKRFWTIFKIIVYFGIIFYIWSMFNGYGAYHIFKVFMGARFGGMWYMFSILPLYVITSFISLPQCLSQRKYIQMLVVVCFLWLLTNGLMYAPFHYRLEYNLNILLIYMFIGFIIRKIRFPNKAGLYFIGFSITSVVISVLFLTSKAKNPEAEGYVNIASLLVFIQTLLIFQAFSVLDFRIILSSKAGRILDQFLTTVAKYSIGIFGWHTPFVFAALKPWLEQFNLRGYQVFLIMLITAPLFSLFIAMFDTWFWQNMRSILKPIYNPLLGRVKRYL